ncbi:MAG: pyruvate formate lyase-activating protein [Balneolaceae bacterium]|nr:MAG: pyruvate formate lyase-activating protein [Balneolaceae bacterium]
MENVTGFIHSRESAGTLDGPGIRRVLFLQGCPLNCLYCHNPDARPFKCGIKTDALTELREIARNKDFLIKTGGGVTLSGGEPLSQPEFVKAIFEGCKLMGIHTTLDTSGFTGHRADDELLSYTDLVLLDIKHIRPPDYKTLTGVKLQPTLEFAIRLSDKNIPVWIRHVLVPGYTDNTESLRELAEFVQTLRNVERVEILPYHKMGAYKWVELGLENQLADIPEPDENMIHRAKETLKTSGVPVY